MATRMTVNGVSVCPTGEERHEYFTPAFARRTKKRFCQYDYRHTLEECRRKRNEWLQRKTDKEAKR